MRRGISLLEVLISIGIVAVGLLSIAALLPVGSIQVQRADTELRKTDLGKNWLREFSMRGMNVINPNPAQSTWVKADGTNYNPTAGLTPPDPYLPPVAIDPLMVAVHAAAVDNFPAGAALTGAPTMKRLGLRGITRPLAEAIFVS